MTKQVDWATPYPDTVDYGRKNAVLENWAKAKGTSGGFALASRFVTGAREAIKEWREAPDRLSHRLAGPGGQMTSVLRGRLEGCGMSEEHALDAAEEEMAARFGYQRKAA